MKTKYRRLRQTATRELANVPSPPHHIRHTDINCTPDNLGNLVTVNIIFCPVSATTGSIVIQCGALFDAGGCRVPHAPCIGSGGHRDGKIGQGHPVTT